MFQRNGFSNNSLRCFNRRNTNCVFPLCDGPVTHITRSDLNLKSMTNLLAFSLFSVPTAMMKDHLFDCLTFIWYNNCSSDSNSTITCTVEQNEGPTIAQHRTVAFTVLITLLCILILVCLLITVEYCLRQIRRRFVQTL